MQGGPSLPKVMVSNRFVTSAEADFFRVLQRVVGPRGHVLAQAAITGRYTLNPAVKI